MLSYVKSQLKIVIDAFIIYIFSGWYNLIWELDILRAKKQIYLLSSTQISEILVGSNENA